MTEKERKLVELRASFDALWPMSRMENLTLEEWANREKTSFIYWVEFKTMALGGIRGGSSLKFMLYARADGKVEPPRANWSSDGQYAWASHLGASAEAAFGQIKAALLPLIRAAANDDLEGIDRISMWGDTVKWKIASLFHPTGFTVFNLRRAIEDLSIAQPNTASPTTLLEAQRRLQQARPEGVHPILFAADLRKQFDASMNFGDAAQSNPAPTTFLYNGKPFDPDAFTGTYWILKAGGGSKYWQAFQEEEVGAIDYENWPDLSSFDSREAIAAAVPSLEPGWSEHPYNHTLAMWEFSHVIAEGDIIIAADGRYKLLGVGVVTEPYWHDPEAEPLTHRIGVDWVRTGAWAVDKQSPLALKTLLNISQYDDEESRFWPRRLLDQIFHNRSPHAQGEGGADLAFLADSFLAPEAIRPILKALEVKKNVILQGPPGTGKTFIAKRLAYTMMGERDDSRIEMVQFHQSYSYEDFIQGYRPVDGGQFDRQDGVFHRFCARARADDRPHFFIIDEINRGNLSKIFGELMMLIEADKRGHELQLTYSRAGEPRFSIPANVHLIGTMNTADRSLAVVDYALRRRFAFFRLGPTFNEKFQARLEADGCPPEWTALIAARLNALNRTIREDHDLGEGFEIGHSYFVGEARWSDVPPAESYRAIVDQEIAPMLAEFWFENREKAAAEAEALLQDLPS